MQIKTSILTCQTDKNLTARSVSQEHTETDFQTSVAGMQTGTAHLERVLSKQKVYLYPAIPFLENCYPAGTTPVIKK